MARPPRLPDAAILELIAGLRAQHPALTGLHLRAELTRRHGMPGGVRRIYRLLRQAMQPPSAPAPSGPDPPSDDLDLQAQLVHALERARLAEEREDAHQTRWAGEIDALRTKLYAVRSAAQRLPIVEDELRARSRELAAAYHRIADLEARLR